MAEKNPYYIDAEDSRKLSLSQLRAAKYNNRYLWIIITNLVRQDGRRASSVVPDGTKAQLLLGNLPYTDRETGVQYGDLGAKICFLIQTLEENEKERQFFAESYFSEVIHVLRKGSTDKNIDAPDRWSNYQPLPACDPKYLGRGAFTSATLMYCRDDNCPVGLNMAKLIDCLVVGNGRGGYKINHDFDAFKNVRDSKQMLEAIQSQLRDFKNMPAFRKSFTHPPADYSDSANSI